MFVYPKANQTHDQQLIDESDCYNSVQQQTGINPQASGPQAPSSADQTPLLHNREQHKRSRLRVALARCRERRSRWSCNRCNHRKRRQGRSNRCDRGTVRGGRRQRQANEEAKETGAQAAVSQQQQAYGQSKAAYNQQMSTFKRGFSAGMDARGYSVK